MEERQYQVLLADDEPIERMVLEKKLKRYFGESLRIRQAENGREAVEAFRRERCQVVILDIAMPEMNGAEAAEAIRKLDASCSIIFLSAYDDFSYTRKAIQVKALDYLLKPCEDEDLVAVLEEALHQADQSRGMQEEALHQADRSRWMQEEALHQADRSREMQDKQEKPSEPVLPPGRTNAESEEPVRPSARENAAEERMAQAAEKIRDYLQKNYMKEISMQEAARQMEYSDAYFCKLFKQCFGQNFTTYLTMLRVNEAKKLLNHPLVNIREVSMKVGYYDSNYFAKVFKRYTGMIPSDYRNSQSAQKYNV